MIGGIYRLVKWIFKMIFGSFKAKHGKEKKEHYRNTEKKRFK